MVTSPARPLSTSHTRRPRVERCAPRGGYSLLELLVVIAILIILGAIIAPTFTSISKDSQVKAAADTVRGRAMAARSAAISENRTYKLAVSSDGLRVRVAPDDTAFTTQAVSEDDDDAGPTVTEDNLPKGVSAKLVVLAGQQSVTDDAGWVRVATFNPDGTCRDDQAVIEVAEPGITPLWVRIRGLTGATAVGPKPKGAL